MIDGLKPYPAYKDSGVPWLGQVPSNWNVTALRALTLVKKGRQPSRLFGPERPSGGVPYLSMNYMRSSRQEPTEFAVPEPGLVIADTGATLLLWDGANAGEFFLSRGGVVSSTSALVTPQGIASDYFFYACQIVEPHLRALTVGMGIPHVDGNVLKNLRVPVPLQIEQSAIVRFLDHADARIRRYIRAKQKLIKLLEEQKQVIIHRAVTRGLDPNVQLKPSGVEWLGHVPEHWDVQRLGRIAKVFNGATPSRMEPAYWSAGTIPWLSSGKVNDWLVQTPSEMVTDRALLECSISIVPKGAVIIGLVGQGKTRGKSALLGIDTCINQNIAAIVPADELDGKFILYFLTAFYAVLREYGRGGNQEALNCQIVSNWRVPIPTKGEQSEIIADIGSTLRGVIDAEQRIGKEIKLIREFRTRLIADVVTGKLDVREAAAKLPAEALEVEPLDEIEDALQDDSTADDIEAEAADAA